MGWFAERQPISPGTEGHKGLLNYGLCVCLCQCTGQQQCDWILNPVWMCARGKELLLDSTVLGYTFHFCPVAASSVRFVSDEILCLLILAPRLSYIFLKPLWPWLFCNVMAHCYLTVFRCSFFTKYLTITM